MTKQYIKKSDVVAGIEKLQKYRRRVFNEIDQGFEEGRDSAFEDVLSFLNTIEVKDVDLSDGVRGTIDYPFIGYDFPNIYPNYQELKDYCDKNGIKDKDKVRIIIIKEK